MTFGIGDGVSSAWGATSDRSSSPRKLLGDDCLAAAPPPLQSGNLPSSIHSTHLTVVAQSILVRSTTGRLDLQFVIPVGRGSPLSPSRCSMEGTRGPSFGLNWVGSGSGTTSPELCNFHLHPSTNQPIPTHQILRHLFSAGVSASTLDRWRIRVHLALNRGLRGLRDKFPCKIP